jgi:hypothetical protein
MRTLVILLSAAAIGLPPLTVIPTVRRAAGPFSEGVFS